MTRLTKNKTAICLELIKFLRVFTVLYMVSLSKISDVDLQ